MAKPMASAVFGAKHQGVHEQWRCVKNQSRLLVECINTHTRTKRVDIRNPCGYLGHHNGKCRCTPDQVTRYRARISGPLLDRIDLQIEVPALRENELSEAADGEASVIIRVRVEQARQVVRQGKPNAQLGPAEVDAYCAPDMAGAALMKQAAAHLDLSARAYHRILKVARTIADLAGASGIAAPHIAEAVQYRRLYTGG